MKKILFLLAMIFGIYSCSEQVNPLNRSIMDGLSVEEMNAIISKNPSFEKMYKHYLSDVKFNKLDSARFMNISYSRLLSFFLFQDTIDAYKYTDKYNKIGKEYQERADKMVEEWVKYLRGVRNGESDSLKAIYKEYKQIVELRENIHDDVARMAYVLERSFFITEVIDKDFTLIPSYWGMSMATKHMIRKDSLCHQLFLLTKRREKLQDDFLKAIKKHN